MLKKIFNFIPHLDSFNDIDTIRSVLFRIGILFQFVFLFINAIRHLIRHDYESAVSVSVFAIVTLLLLFNNLMSLQKKYLIAVYLFYFFISFFAKYIETTKDVIQVNSALIITSAILLEGKKFFAFLFLAVTTYYITFFALGYEKIYNFLAFIIYIVLSLMINSFIKQAKKNEQIIINQVEKLKEIDELKSRLFTNISHEIRTPLTLILGANDQLEVTQQSQIIKINAHRLLNLVTQILDLSLLETKKRRVELTTINLPTFINEITQNFQVVSQNKKINFNSFTSSSINAVDVDKDAYYKIITNLLSNAFKFSTENDLVFLEILDSGNQMLQIKVSDTGIGIQYDELEHIFNQFYHSNVGLEASYGIGLALVKELVSSLGGSVSVESEFGRGSIFTVNLPKTLKKYDQLGIDYKIIVQNEVTNLHVIETALIEKVTTVTSINKEKIILVVEDNDDIRNFLINLLKEHYIVISAIDGKEGIEKAFESIPDIIISDIMMPNTDGLQLLETLKNDFRTSHIPIVLLTAKSDHNDLVKGLQLEADDYITKPFNQTTLLLRIKNKIKATKRLLEKHQKPIIQLVTREDLSIEDHFLNKISLNVFENLANENFGPDELASTIGLSKSQLLRKIQAVTNCTTSSYIRNIRLEYAKLKLQNNVGSISEIAYQTGFSSPNYFSKCFKEYVGASPKEFLNN